MIIFGTRATNIGTINIDKAKCDYCEEPCTQRITVFGKYFHIFWIPFFPTSKVLVSECTTCKRTISENEFSRVLKGKYELKKDEIKRPYWHWSFVIFFVIINVISTLLLKSFMAHY